MFFNNENKKIIANYLNKSFIKKMLYIGRGLDIATVISDYTKSDSFNEYEKRRELIKALWIKETKHISDIFTGREFGALKLLLDEENAERFKEIWDRAPLYTYTIGYIRRSYRSNKTSSLYLSKNILKLKEFIYLAAMDFSLDKYLKDTKSNYEDISVIADIIAIELDKNNQSVLEGIKEIIYNDNNIAIVTREIIRGMLMSRNGEAHRIIGELLLAARLQEGLRQAIVENMDEGSGEGFIYLLKLIIDNNLSRFSSVVRAFGTWTGLGIDMEKPKVINKCLHAAYDCLTNKDIQKECINSSDNLLIYIGIWSVAFDEVEDIDNIIDGLLQAPEKYKKLAALQFLSETQFTTYRHTTACKVLMERDFEVLAWAVKNIFNDVNYYELSKNPKSQLEQYYKGMAYSGCRNLFNELKEIVDIMPKKEIKFEGSVFPWMNISITKPEIIEKMIFAVALSYDNNVVDTLIDYRDNMNPESRKLFVELFISKPKNTRQKVALIEGCSDRSSSVRESAFKIINEMNLSSEDYKLIEDFLQYKSGDLRKDVIKLLLKQENKELEACIERLFLSKNENKRLAAIDMVSAIESVKKHRNVYERCLDLINSNKDVGQKEKMLAENIIKDVNDNKTFKYGFGLYDNAKEVQIEGISRPERFNIKSIFSANFNELYSIMSKFSSLIYENRDFEYEKEEWDGTKTITTLGGSYFLEPLKRGENKLESFPISDKIREFSKNEKLTLDILIQLNFDIDIAYSLTNQEYQRWFENLFGDIFDFKGVREFFKSVYNLPYFSHIRSYIHLLISEYPYEERFKIGKDMCEYLFTVIPQDKHYIEYKIEKEIYYYSSKKNCISDSKEVRYWLALIRDNNYNNETFIEYFKTAYNYYRSNKFEENATLALDHFGRAQELGIIDDNEIYKELMSRTLSPKRIEEITNTHWNYHKVLLNYPRIIELGNSAVNTIVNIEVKRGELNTEVTHLAVEVDKCYGVEIFTSILLNMENDTYIRGYNFVNDDSTKKQVLSHLLKCCYPGEGEGAETLRSCLEGKKITSKQLIEGAMYSPQWLDIISEYLGYDGLKSACWYFHAHVNDVFSEEKAAVVARYSPISVQDFKDGAFDQEWFMDAYKTIGEKNFKLVYDSAKYIAGGGLHKRSQLFADATLGSLDIEEIKKRVVDKRNKDYLLTYGLIPIKETDDLLGRYEYIHQYLKESKKFGAQRQASETRSANIALLNLARNAGYSDVNRLSWNMETAKLDSINQYLLPRKLEDIEVQLLVNELGQAEITCTKDGKVLKDIPSKYRRHEYVQEIKEIKKSLKEQYIRARGSFEASMERANEFEARELEQLCMSPVLAPIIKNLVFISNNKLGYFNQCGLVDYNGEIYKLDLVDRLLIAHPIHLYESGKWSEYQKDIFTRRVVQPFKQVFRELYLPNEDELREGNQSRRYAGHQVQPKKTLALLKTRGWMASNEEGLQKVYYKENIIGTIYALADWFSPSEIEAPTIELVRFEDRRTFMPVTIEKVPKLIFSEVMRDLDLVVSVAHVGGIDPEASLSTVEIRRAIIRELLGLLKLENVTIKESHAFIAGVHGEYTVHLGSGVVHKMAGGSLSILPVHSQHRGRIFLPFIDGDPKSAEIISKIILLAEDKKLKDPSILSQIAR